MEADDVFADTTSATEESACGVMLPLSHSRKKASFPALSYLVASVCVFLYVLVHACACVLDESSVLFGLGMLSFSQRLFSESLLHVAPPGPKATRSLPAASARRRDPAKYRPVQEQEGCKPVTLRCIKI